MHEKPCLIPTVLYIPIYVLRKNRYRAIWDTELYKSGPSCSKLTMSLVNDSLKFTSSDTQIC